MAFWLPNTGNVYLPPSRPVPKVLPTDEFVINTDILFYASTERLLQVGHPYFPIISTDDNSTVLVPKVSPSQYRVMRLKLPDPNQFALIDQDIYDPNTERLVWKLRGLELDRGGPLGIGSTGHPLFNKYGDTENPIGHLVDDQQQPELDQRLNVSFEPKQTQILIVGCTPPVGQHWDIAKPCQAKAGDCPPIALEHTTIQDGDMCDIGLGAVNFKNFSQDRATAPLDVIDNICKWPDFLKMSKDVYGNALFFFTRREQIYARHFAVRSGEVGDKIPESKNKYYIKPKDDGVKVTSSNYLTTPSGSLTSTDGQIFGRPYWLQKAQGTNNGICWNNELFITAVDNTRATNFSISIYKAAADGKLPDNYNEYKASDFKQFTRHTEEFEVELVFQLCKVPLTSDILAHLNVMDANILENWKLAFVPPPPQGLEDKYRFLNSSATMCPPPEPNKEPDDPYDGLQFWTIDLRDKFTADLSQTSLGRRFLYQMGMVNGKRPRSEPLSSKRSVKRRKTKH